MEKELLQDTFGSILTVLILLEFTHSVYTSLRNCSVIIEATVIVLIAIVVVAQKLNSVDFKSATLEQVASYEASLWRLASCTGCLVPQLVTKSASGSRRRPN